MKIKSCVIAIMTLMIFLFSVPTYADLVFEADGKRVEVIGYAIAKDYSDDVLYILLKFTNNSDKTTMPMACFQVSAYDNGIQLQDAFVINGYNGYYGSTTEVRPGATMMYYEAFKKPTSKNVEVEIKKWLSFDSKALTFRLDMGGDKPEQTSQPDQSSKGKRTLNDIVEDQRNGTEDKDGLEPDESTSNDQGSTTEPAAETDEQKAIRKLKKRVAKLETRLGELEERIAQLENA